MVYHSESNFTTEQLYPRPRRHSYKNEERQKSKFWLCYKYVGNYLSNSTAHGLRYIADPRISFGERICWLLCFIMAVLIAGFFVSIIYVNYDQDPVIITVNPQPVTISTIPFPSVTVCSMNKVKRSVADAILKNGTDVEKSILSSYCETSSSENTSKTTDRKSSNWGNILKFILKAAQPCKEMIKLCMWKSVEINCEEWFNPTLTDDGLCCTFNQLPSSYIFRSEDNYNKLAYNYPLMVEDWSQETGYPEEATWDAFPWRAEGAGIHFGLTLVLDAAVDEYFCSSGSSAGFKILLHNPLETPSVADYGSMVGVNWEVWNEIEVNIQEAAEAIKSLPVAKRQCYFNNEKYLRFFRSYTLTNCNMECRTNYTLNMCGCVPHFLPRDNPRICGFKDSNCAVDAEVLMQVTEVQDEAECQCLPSCFELSFDENVQFGMLHKTTIGRKFLKNMSVDYFMENAVILHNYFQIPLLTKYIKGERYGFSEFVSNTGGLLGFFLGISVLSAVELVYYLSLRILCSVMRSKEKISETQRYYENEIVYPFAH